MNVTFTEEEYRRLISLAYLGEWMINAIRKEPEPAYEDLVEKIYAQAKGTTAESAVQFNQEDLEWIPAESFEEEAHTIIDEYDDKTFWEELTARLTERDLLEQHGERQVKGMRPDQRLRAAGAIAKVYTKEFEEFGLDRLAFTE